MRAKSFLLLLVFGCLLALNQLSMAQVKPRETRNRSSNPHLHPVKLGSIAVPVLARRVIAMAESSRRVWYELHRTSTASGLHRTNMHVPIPYFPILSHFEWVRS